MLINAAALLAASTGFRARFLDGMQANEPWHEPFVETVESDKSQERILIPDGLGEMREWLGERDVNSVELDDYTLKNKTWEKSIDIPVDAFKDDELGVFSGQAASLGRIAASHPGYLVEQLLVGGFTNTGYDGKAFFAANHPGKDGANQTNIVSGALSSTTFRTALSQAQAITNREGRPIRLREMGLKPYLIVGPSLRATAKSIVSIDTLASGAGNPDAGEAELIINEGLIGPYASYWFLVFGGGDVRPFIVQMREKPSLHMVTDPKDTALRDRKVVPMWSQGRWNAGYLFWQLAQGSTGA